MVTERDVDRDGVVCRQRGADGHAVDEDGYRGVGAETHKGLPGGAQRVQVQGAARRRTRCRRRNGGWLDLAFVQDASPLRAFLPGGGGPAVATRVERMHANVRERCVWQELDHQRSESPV